MATLTDTVPNITYPDAPVITTVTEDSFDAEVKTYDSSLVENTGQLTYYTVKTGAQLNHIADQYLIDTDTNNIFDSSLVDYTGQLTYYTVKTSSQSSWTFDSHALIEIENNTLTQDLDFTGQLQVTIVKVSSAVLWTGFTHASSSFGEGTGASTTTGTGPTQDDSYEILIQ